MQYISNTTILVSSSSLPMRGIKYISRDISSQCLGQKRNSTDVVSVTSLPSSDSPGRVDPKCVYCQCLSPLNTSSCEISGKRTEKNLYHWTWVLYPVTHITHLWHRCHNSKFVIFQEKILKVLKCYNFLRVRRRHVCSPAASFANCVMTLYLLKVHLQVFLCIPVTKKCQILICNTLVVNDRYH